jgi:hypothetical protein
MILLKSLIDFGLLLIYSKLVDQEVRSHGCIASGNDSSPSDH